MTEGLEKVHVSQPAVPVSGIPSSFGTQCRLNDSGKTASGCVGIMTMSQAHLRPLTRTSLKSVPGAVVGGCSCAWRRGQQILEWHWYWQHADVTPPKSANRPAVCSLNPGKVSPCQTWL